MDQINNEFIDKINWSVLFTSEKWTGNHEPTYLSTSLKRIL